MLIKGILNRIKNWLDIFLLTFLTCNKNKINIKTDLQANFHEATKPTSSSVSEKRFDFLDGFRGLCAFSIIVVHSAGGKEYYKNTIMGIMTTHGGFTQSIAMPGFFLLSSFLLTYRLTYELIDESSSLVHGNVSKKREYIKIISKYFIRRFFRIYIPFVIYCTCIKLSPSYLGGGQGYASWLKLVTLRFNMGDFNHLWTIPIEINYYFFIPIISMVYLKLYQFNKRFLYLLVSICIILAAYHLEHNLFYNFPRNPFVVNVGDFRAPTFATFLCGSILAFTYLSYENEIGQTSNKVKEIISSMLFQRVLNLFTVAMIIFCFRSEYLSSNNGGIGGYCYWYKGGFYWSINIFLLLISSSEYSFGRRFFNINLMKKFGHYSYGIYLWHPTAIKFVERIDKNKLIYFKNPYEYFTFIVILAYILGYLFHVLIETNMIRLATHLCKSSYFKSSKHEHLNSLPTQQQQN
jgi:peptidoglycan/LPS O-acetylase OafA/YrhL